MSSRSHTPAAGNGRPSVFDKGNPGLDIRYTQSFGLDQYLQIAKGLAESINDRELHGKWAEFFLQNIPITLDELNKVRDTNIAVAGHYETLLSDFSSLDSRFQVARRQNEDFSIRNARLQADLLAANQKIEQKQTELLAVNQELAEASRVKEFHLERISILEQAIQKFRGLVVNHRIGSYQVLDWWVRSSLLKPMDQLYLEHTARDTDELRSVSKTGSNMVEEFWGAYDTEPSVACTVDVGAFEKKFLSDSLPDKPPANTNPAHSSKAEASDQEDESPTVRNAGAPSDAGCSSDSEAISEEGTATSMYTADLRQILIRNKQKAMLSATFRNKAKMNREFMARNITVTNNADAPPAENLKEVASTALVTRTPTDKLPAKDHPAVKPAPTYNQRKGYNETSQDKTKYDNNARLPGQQTPPWGDGPGPQVVYADPDEVAGSWNDVPVPLELLRKPKKTKKPSKPPPPVIDRTSKREVVLTYLPHYITTQMLSTFVRGGRIEEFFIEHSGYYGPKIHPMSCAIRFYSEDEAAAFVNWVKADPPLYVDDYLVRCGTRMIHKAPALPEGGATRSVLFVVLPEGVDSPEDLEIFVKDVAKNNKIIIGIEDVVVRGPGPKEVSMEDDAVGVASDSEKEQTGMPGHARKEETSDTEKEQINVPGQTDKGKAGEEEQTNVPDDTVKNETSNEKEHTNMPEGINKEVAGLPDKTNSEEAKTPQTKTKRIYPGYVAFQKMKQSLPMFEAFKQLGLEVKWARDRCDGPLRAKELRYEFVPIENMDHEDYDPQYPHIAAQAIQQKELDRIQEEEELLQVQRDLLDVKRRLGLL